MNLVVNKLLRPTAGHEVYFATFFHFGDLLIEGAPRRQTGTMCEQLTKGHMRLAVHAKTVEETGHTIFEPELRLAHQHHHRDCSSQRLRQRREVEHGFQPHRQRLWLERAATEGAL